MKKKKWNRFLAVVLLAAMAASLLSGCGKKSREQAFSFAVQASAFPLPPTATMVSEPLSFMTILSPKWQKNTTTPT